MLSVLVVCSCNTQTQQPKQEEASVSKYKKEPLPTDFSYKIIEDKSNDALEKNELTLEINKKISVEQIATLADKFFSTKKKQRRFYIFYLLPSMKIGSGAWATSHFDPELDIKIIGATKEQESSMKKSSDSVEGEIIGKWHEEQYTKSTYIIFKKQNKTLLRILFSNGQISDEEIVMIEKNKQKRINYKGDGYNGEYFILNKDKTLGFYNSEGKNFTTAKVTE